MARRRTAKAKKTPVNRHKTRGRKPITPSANGHAVEATSQGSTPVEQTAIPTTRDATSGLATEAARVAQEAEARATDLGKQCTEKGAEVRLLKRQFKDAKKTETDEVHARLVQAESDLATLQAKHAEAKVIKEAADEALVAARRPSDWFHLTDKGNGELFAQEHSGRLRFCFGLDQWFVWVDSGVWYADRGEARGHVHRLAKRTVENMVTRASKMEQPWQKQLLGHARVTESEHARRMMVEAARSEPGIQVPGDAFDHQDDLLNVLNGVVNLKTSDLLSHDPDLMMSRQAQAEYEPGYTHPLFDAYLDTAFGLREPDQFGPARDAEEAEALRDYIQRVVGAILFGGNVEEKVFIALGEGGTGKGTFLDLFGATLGTYATACKMTALIENKWGDNRFDLWEHVHSRFVCAQEAGAGQRLNAERIKALTSNDLTRVETKYIAERQVKPKMTIMIASNFPLEVDIDDSGMYRRVKVIPFNCVPKRPDLYMRNKLRTDPDCRKAFLAWAVEGALKWQQHPLAEEPESVREATEKFWVHNDPLGEWFVDLEVAEGDKKTSDWFVSIDEAFVSAKAFKPDLTKLELRTYLERRGAVYGKRGGRGQQVAGFWGVRWSEDAAPPFLVEVRSVRIPASMMARVRRMMTEHPGGEWAESNEPGRRNPED